MRTVRTFRKFGQVRFDVAGKAMACACLAFILAACSTAEEALPHQDPQGGSAIRGVVTTDDYQFSLATLEPSGLSTMAVRRESGASPATGSVLRADGAEGDAVPGQILVQYQDDDASRFLSLRSGSEAGGARRGGRTERVQVGSEAELASTLERLSQDPAVARVSPNYYVHPTAQLSDPHLTQQWALAAAGVSATWSRPGGSAEPVVVAVIDTGFDLEHEDMAGRYLPGYDFCADATCTATDRDPGHGSDANWHGTHVAGVIGAVGDNGVGIAGVAGAGVRILPVKIFNDQGAGANVEVLIKGLRWAAGLPVDGAPLNENPARIINLSLAGGFPSEVLQDAVDEARAAGALIIASTGNAGTGRVASPAAADGVVGVGASNRSFRRSCFSNFGVGSYGPGGVDLLAPGGEADGSAVGCGIDPAQVHGIMSAVPGNGYGSATGTSMAAPMVAGAAALILADDPALSVHELEERLLASAYNDPSYMNRAEYGAGVLRADRAVGLVGPGDAIRVELLPDGSGASLTREVTLQLTGGSTSFDFSGIPAGSYELIAEDAAGGAYGWTSLSIGSGEERLENVILRARP